MAIVLGLGLATIASRTDDPAYDDVAVLVARVQRTTDRLELPEGFQLAQGSPLAPVDPLAVTVFLDGRGLHVGEQSFALDDAPLGSFCSVSTPVAQALEWERRVVRAFAPSDRDVSVEKVNLAIDARTPYRKVIAAWRSLTCEGLLPVLVFADPAGTPGGLPYDAAYRGYDVRFRIAVAPDGYRVLRGRSPAEEAALHPWAMNNDEVDRRVGYGADCAPGADGPSVSIHGTEAAVAACVLRAMDDEAGGPSLRARLYPTCGHSAVLAFAVSAAPETPFRDVAPALLAARDVLSFAGFSSKP